MKVLSIQDNGGKTIDRYTVVFDELATTISGETYHCGLAMDERPFHPQGFCQHVEVHPDSNLGQLITLDQLPQDCQKAVAMELLSEDRIQKLWGLPRVHVPTPDYHQEAFWEV